MSLVVVLLSTVWRMTRENMLGIEELKAEDRHSWQYWFKLENLVDEGNLTPVIGLLSTFAGITYLNEHMDGVLFPLALLVLVAGLVWQMIALIIAFITGLSWHR